MIKTITFIATVDGREQYRWVEKINTAGGLTVRKFNRTLDIVDDKVEIKYHQKCPDVQSISNYRHMREMEDKSFIRVGDINSWDFINAGLLYQEGGSWHKYQHEHA